jgi:cytidylate kinase
MFKEYTKLNKDKEAYEKYIDFILTTRGDLVLETDIGGFRDTNEKEVFSIFLITDFQVRIKRLEADKRGDEIAALAKRDQLLGKDYMEMFKIDYFNIKFISDYYTFLLNNSKISIGKELELVYTSLKNSGFIDKNRFINLKGKILNTEKSFNEYGKEYFLKLNESLNLIPTAEELIRDVKQILPNEVSKLPAPLRKILDNIN